MVVLAEHLLLVPMYLLQVAVVVLVLVLSELVE
jgi:hypothetical protein